MAKSDCINPLLILDELDKASFYPSDRPALTGPLLQILEADTAAKFEDACLKCELDVSHVSWLATANDISQVPGPILSRFHIIHVQEAENEAKAWQVQRLFSSVADEMGLRKYVTAEVARDALKDYLHLSIREWKMKLQLAIAMNQTIRDLAMVIDDCILTYPIQCRHASYVPRHENQNSGMGDTLSSLQCEATYMQTAGFKKSGDRRVSQLEGDPNSEAKGCRPGCLTADLLKENRLSLAFSGLIYDPQVDNGGTDARIKLAVHKPSRWYLCGTCNTAEKKRAN